MLQSFYATETGVHAIIAYKFPVASAWAPSAPKIDMFNGTPTMLEAHFSNIDVNLVDTVEVAVRLFRNDALHQAPSQETCLSPRARSHD